MEEEGVETAGTQLEMLVFDEDSRRLDAVAGVGALLLLTDFIAGVSAASFSDLDFSTPRALRIS